MATVGGRREGAGRPKGRLNKATADVKALAQEFGPAAMQALVSILKDKKSPPAARVAAAKEVLDRAYGKAKQSLEVGGTDGGPLLVGSISEEQLERLAKKVNDEV
ncbi:hypothetical protein [Metapseudomonas otitidis]|uniref:hypothetical protein n=1 Tax=Metapseudomonas otitidis TaxID=319939 RepID=UPI0024487A06|nr:hypothetical protein [Pseudomonas otitidis]MDG9784653.1 hypothetical protein [Pseudomonas otitidis]